MSNKDGQLVSILVTLWANRAEDELATGVWSAAQIVAGLGLVAAGVKRALGVQDSDITAQTIKWAAYEKTRPEKLIGKDKGKGTPD